MTGGRRTGHWPRRPIPTPMLTARVASGPRRAPARRVGGRRTGTFACRAQARGGLAAAAAFLERAAALTPDPAHRAARALAAAQAKVQAARSRRR